MILLGGLVVMCGSQISCYSWRDLTICVEHKYPELQSKIYLLFIDSIYRGQDLWNCVYIFLKATLYKTSVLMYIGEDLDTNDNSSSVILTAKVDPEYIVITDTCKQTSAVNILNTTYL